MPLSPVNAVSRILKWDDFEKKDKKPPGPGQAATGAETKTKMAADAPTIEAVGSEFKLAKEPTVSVTLESTSWVASFVFDWPQKMQDDLLAHEQVHYLITALSARDGFNAMMVVLGKTYPTKAACTVDVQAAQKMMLSKKIQEKYDADTKHKPTQNAEIQAKWTTAVVGCKTTGAPLRPALIALGLFTE